MPQIPHPLYKRSSRAATAADDSGTMIDEALPMAGRFTDDPGRHVNDLVFLEKSEF
jgi:hypothetical protein